MKGLLPAVVILLQLFLGIIGVAIYETVHAAQLSLPTAPLGIPVLLLPLLALANAFFAGRSTALRLRGRDNTNSAKHFPPHLTTLVTVLQVVQGIIAAVLATLLAAAPAVNSCLLENRWQRMYSAHDEDAIRHLQDTFNCCGFNSARDRAWPFPHGGGQQHARCDEALGRQGSCRAPWTGAMRATTGVQLGIVVMVAIFQILTLLILTGSPYLRRAIWYLMDTQSRRREYESHNGQREPCSHDRERNQILNGERRPLLGDGVAHTDSESYEEEHGHDDEHQCDRCGRKNGGGERSQQQGGNQLPGLDSSLLANEWTRDN